MAFVILTLVLLLSLFIIPLGLPGIWVMIASAVVYNILTHTSAIGWFSLIAISVIALIAEYFEFTMAGKYARKYGGGRRASWGAMIGGVVGAFVGFPVPIVGPIIGGFIGAFIGALIGEKTSGATVGDSTRAATGSLIGRALGAAMKIGFGSAIAVWIFFAAMG
jgi:uncharacterized protein YqgC (DUF456 family)